jgi:hypothetical protein
VTSYTGEVLGASLAGLLVNNLHRFGLDSSYAKEDTSAKAVMDLVESSRHRDPAAGHHGNGDARASEMSEITVDSQYGIDMPVIRNPAHSENGSRPSVVDPLAR